MGMRSGRAALIHLSYLFVFILITPAILKSQEADNRASKPDEAQLLAFHLVMNSLTDDYFSDSPDSIGIHIDSARAMITLDLDTTVNDALHFMIGLLYVKSDSLDQAVAEYDQISPKRIVLGQFLWQKILCTPEGLKKYYPNLPGIEFAEIFASITPIVCKDVVERLNLDFSSPAFGNSRLVGWGCFVNADGDLITTCGKFYDIDRAVAGIFHLAKIADVLTKIIGDEYVMASTYGFGSMSKRTQDELHDIRPANIIGPDDLLGDTVVILQSPFNKSMKICMGLINSVVADPLTDQIIEVRTFEELLYDMAIVVSLKGELIGMISTVRTKDDYVYAYPVNKLTKFRFKNRRSVPAFTDDLIKLSDVYTIDQEALNYMAAGKLNLWRGYIESAMGMFEKARELGSDLALPDIYLGYCNWKLENFEEAEQNFLAAYAIDNELDDAYYNLGLLYLEQGRTSEAEKAFRQANKINSKNPYTLYELGKLYLESDKKRDVKKIAHDLEWLDKNLAEELKKQI